MDEFRVRIDAIDQQIIALLGQRFEVSRDIGRYKREHGLPVLDKDRERALINRIRQLATQNNIDPSLAIEVYERIVTYSRASQRPER